MTRRMATFVLLGALGVCDTAAEGQAPPRTGAVARKAPAAPPAALVEAERALDAGDPERALTLAEDFARTRPASAAAHVIAARAHLERGSLDRAYERLRQGLIAAPGHVDALYYLGLISGRLAERELERLAAVAPDSARVQQVLAESFEVQGRRQEAASAYEAALARDPTLLDALLALGKLRRVALQCEEAIALYERAEAVRPTYDGAFGLGVCLQTRQEDERAVARFREALERDPRAPLAWMGIGTSLARLGRTSEAITHLQRAIALEPRLGEAWYALGRVYRQAGDTARADEAFARARQIAGR